MLKSAYSYYRLGRLSPLPVIGPKFFVYMLALFLWFNLSWYACFAFMIFHSLLKIRARHTDSVSLQSLAPAPKSTIILGYWIECFFLLLQITVTYFLFSFFTGNIPFKSDFSLARNACSFLFIIFTHMLAWNIGLMLSLIGSKLQCYSAYAMELVFIWGFVLLLSVIYPISLQPRVFDRQLLEQIALSGQYYMYPLIAGGLMLISGLICIPIFAKKVY